MRLIRPKSLNMATKQCTKCHIEKPINEFYKHKQQKDGRQPRCKVCYYKPKEQASRNLKSRYGISLEDYDRMLEDQGGCCKVCGTDDPGGGRGRFQVDHNHTTGKVRGLLCIGCNTGLGSFKDSVEVLSKAITYLVDKGSYGV